MSSDDVTARLVSALYRAKAAANGQTQRPTEDAAAGTYVIGNGKPGRDGRTADVIIDGDPYISPAHARLFRDSVGGYWVEDLGSTNGTWVNGVQRYAATPLRPGDTLRVGRTTLPWRQPGP